MIGEKKGRNGVLMAVDVMGIGGLFVLYPTCFNSNFDNGIFHGIDTRDHRKTRAITGFSRLIDNRVGVTGTHRQ